MFHSERPQIVSDAANSRLSKTGDRSIIGRRLSKSRGARRRENEDVISRRRMDEHIRCSHFNQRERRKSKNDGLERSSNKVMKFAGVFSVCCDAGKTTIDFCYMSLPIKHASCKTSCANERCEFRLCEKEGLARALCNEPLSKRRAGERGKGAGSAPTERT